MTTKQVASFTLVVVLTLTISACNKSTDSANRSNNYKKSYNLTVNGCETGEHVFTSSISERDATLQMCNALKDNSLNNYCAEDVRKELYIQNCDQENWYY